jgi:putative transposase
MEFRLIEEEKSHHKISRMARVLGVTAAGYHAWKKRPASKHSLEDARLRGLIRGVHERSYGIYGAPRVHAELGMAHGEHVACKRVARLMAELGLEGVSRRGKRRCKKTEAEMPAAPDLVRRRFAASAPNELWIADITYVPTWEGWLFLAVVIDACSRRVCG